MSSLFVFRERSLESVYGRVYSVEPRGVPVVPVLAGDVVGAAEDRGVAPEVLFLLKLGMHECDILKLIPNRALGAPAGGLESVHWQKDTFL